MIILGIDPGIGRMGYGVIERVGSKVRPIAYGLIETPSIAVPDRLQLIYEQVQSLMDLHQPAQLATEQLHFAANKTTAFDVNRALGCVLLASAQRNLGWAEYAPSQVKQAVVGNGAAQKSQVAFMVTRILGLAAPPRPDDVADALAIAICHAFRAPASSAANNASPRG